MATSTDSNVRNGPEAVRLAESICPPVGCGHADFLDTLAAAYAEVGRFSEAAQAAKSAARAAESTNEPLKARILERLEGYRQNRPWRRDGLP